MAQLKLWNFRNLLLCQFKFLFLSPVCERLGFFFL